MIINHLSLFVFFFWLFEQWEKSLLYIPYLLWQIISNKDIYALHNLHGSKNFFFIQEELKWSTTEVSFRSSLYESCQKLYYHQSSDLFVCLNVSLAVY